ncbi:MAG TPA: DNA primase [Nitrospiraceae bacterium]|nr:DNA primase [Nitrospiraceae bacterium]
MGQGLIPEDVIHQIRERVDITQVVSDYVTLTKAGQNLKGLCPFHSEKTPSFTVSSSKQMFHCFGCGVGGNVFTFLMKIEGMDFPETVRELGRRTGVTIPDARETAPSPDRGQRQRLEQLHEAAAAWFRQNLLHPEDGRQARAYLAERGIKQETVDAFGLGVAPSAWDGLLRHLGREGYQPVELAAAGLTVAKEQAGRRTQEAAGYYDRFRSRLMFPIYDLRRRVIAFGGRILGDGMPKYLNSPETPLFHKGQALYALERAREAAGRTDTLVIVEGYFDAIALYQEGLTNVAATLGTALTPEHIRTLRRFITRLVLLFDPDPAGVRAALRTLDLFVNSGIAVRVVSLPVGEDPDTFIRKQGTDAFLQLQETAPSLLDFAVEHSLRQAASGLLEDRIRSVDEILRILQKTSHRIEKEECTRRVAERLGINQQRLIERYPELLPKDGRPRGHQDSRVPVVPGPGSPFKGCTEERDLVHLLLQGKLSAADIQVLSAEFFTVPSCRRIVEIGLRHLGDDGRVLVGRLLEETSADADCGPMAVELALSEPHFEDLTAHIRGCLEALGRKRRETAMRELIVKLRAAEQEGRVEEARLLNAQVNELRMSKAGLSPAAGQSSAAQPPAAGQVPAAGASTSELPPARSA